MNIAAPAQSTPNSTSANSSVESRALTLLGQSIPPSQVAAALGVSEARISQLVSDPEFSAKVFELRYQSLIKHNARDATYDTIEDKLAKKLSDLLPLMMRPMEVLKAISVINSVKRRGLNSSDQLVATKQVVTLNISPTLVQHFTTNVNNQIVSVSGKDLTTVQSGNMQKLVESSKALANPLGLPYDPSKPPTSLSQAKVLSEKSHVQTTAAEPITSSPT